MQTTCVLCSASQDYVVCQTCTALMGKLHPGMVMFPQNVADMPTVRQAGLDLRRQILQGHA